MIIALDVDGTAPQWSFVAPIVVRSQNTLYGTHRDHHAHRRLYAKVRDTAQMVFLAMRSEYAIPQAVAKRRIVWTRLLGYRERLFDHGNLVGGMKPIVDAAVLQGLLADDTPALYEGAYLQADDDRTAGPALRVEIWEAS